MTVEMEVAYPDKYETEAVLRDGSKIFLRPVKKDDCEAWLAFVRRLSERTRYYRYHTLPGEISSEDGMRFCTVDYSNTFTFVGEVLRNGRRDIVAVGRYYRLPNQRTAEVTFVIEDAFQGKGIGTKLIELLANAARENGIDTFEAEVLAENEEMMAVFRTYGFHITSDLAGGVYNVSFPVARTGKVTKKEEERERVAIVASLQYVLAPKSIAVIGASRKPGSLGQLLFQCIVQGGFAGTVYPINPNADSIMSVKAYASVLDVPGDIEMAVVAVPATLVARVADECGRKGVRALIVISDGFKEIGPEGAVREAELREVSLGHGMRLVGPNCMGAINTHPEVKMNATFSPIFPPSGNVAFLSQSGAMGLVILEYARNLNMGISTFISVGNRADVSANDLLQYWEQDPSTDVILLYLESFGNPQKFSRIARRASAAKPIVVVKGGRTPAGARAAASHTGALASSEVAVDALFNQAGIIRVDSIEELFAVATLISNQPLPKGKRLAIITNGGGPGIIAADAAQRQGLSLLPLSPDTIAKLKPRIKRDITLNNPLDTTAGATAEEFKGALEVLAEDKDNDAVLVIFIPPVVVDVGAMEDAIRSVVPTFRRNQKPLLACFMGQAGFQARLGTAGKFVPGYAFPENAVVALAKAAEYAEVKRKPQGKIPTIRGIERDKARKLVETVMSRTGQRPLWLSPQEIADLLRYYGIRFAETIFTRTPEETAGVAREIGFPVAVKLASATITHKTEVGGVILDVNSEEDAKRAFNEIKNRLARIGRENEMEGVIVQRMVNEGTETIAGVTQDPIFGPLIMFGLGGIFAELVQDVAFRLHPLTDLDAREQIRSLKMSKVFEGFRGAPPSDTQAIEDLLLRLSAMVEDIPEIGELDFNPVKVLPRGEGYWVVDARIMVK